MIKVESEYLKLLHENELEKIRPERVHAEVNAETNIEKTEEKAIEDEE